MPLHRSDLDAYWTLLATEFSERLDDVRPKIAPRNRMAYVHRARHAMAAAAPYLDDVSELKAHALTALNGLKYLRTSKFNI